MRRKRQKKRRANVQKEGNRIHMTGVQLKVERGVLLEGNEVQLEGGKEVQLRGGGAQLKGRGTGVLRIEGGIKVQENE